MEYTHSFILLDLVLVVLSFRMDSCDILPKFSMLVREINIATFFDKYYSFFLWAWLEQRTRIFDKFVLPDTNTSIKRYQNVLAIWSHRSWSSLYQVMAWRLFCAKPLPIINGHSLWIRSKGRSFSDILEVLKIVLARKFIWKCRPKILFMLWRPQCIQTY